MLENICNEHGVPCDSRFLEVNPAFEAITGLKRDQVIGRLGSEVFPADHAHWTKTYGAVALNGEAIAVEHSTPGAGRHYDVVAFSPAPGQFAVIFHDVTERRRLEEERRVLLTKYAVLFDSFPLGISMTDASGMVREGNPTALRLLGTSEDKLLSHRVGVPQWRILRPAGSPMPPDEFASVRALKAQAVVEDVGTGVARRSWCWSLAFFGLAMRYLDFRKPVLEYANQAVLPFYILHQSVLICVGYFVVRWAIPDLLKWVIILVSSFAIIMGLYEYLIRRVNVLRFLFGLKVLPRRKAVPVVEGQVAAQ